MKVRTKIYKKYKRKRPIKCDNCRLWESKELEDRLICYECVKRNDWS